MYNFGKHYNSGLLYNKFELETIEVICRSATEVNATVTADTSIALSGRSFSAARATLSYDVIGSYVCRSSTPMRMEIELQTPLTISAFSLASALASTVLTATVSLSGEIKANSRAAILTDTAIKLTISSQSPAMAIIEAIALIHTGGTSLTDSRANANPDATVGLSGVSHAVTRSRLEQVTHTIIEAKSTVVSRGYCDIETGMASYSGKSLTLARAGVPVDVTAYLELKDSTQARSVSRIARIVVGDMRATLYNAIRRFNSGISYNTMQGGFTGRGDLTLYRNIVVGEAAFTGAGDFSGEDAVRIVVGDALLSGAGDFEGNDGEVIKTYRVVYDLIFGPTTLGINPREKRARKVYLVVSKAANARMFVSYSTSRDGPFTQEVSIGGGEALSRAKKILPLVSGNPAGGYIYRVRVRGWGEASVHEIVFAVSPRGSKANAG